MSRPFSNNVVTPEMFAKRTGIGSKAYPDVKERTAEHRRNMNYKSRGNYATGGYCGKAARCANVDMLCGQCIKWDKFKEGRSA